MVALLLDNLTVPSLYRPLRKMLVVRRGNLLLSHQTPSHLLHESGYLEGSDLSSAIKQDVISSQPLFAVYRRDLFILTAHIRLPLSHRLCMSRCPVDYKPRFY